MVRHLGRLAPRTASINRVSTGFLPSITLDPRSSSPLYADLGICANLLCTCYIGRPPRGGLILGYGTTDSAGIEAGTRQPLHCAEGCCRDEPTEESVGNFCKSRFSHGLRRLPAQSTTSSRGVRSPPAVPAGSRRTPAREPCATIMRMSL